MVSAIQCRNLSKEFKYKVASKNGVKNFFYPEFKRFKAVDGVSLDIAKGEIFGLLGPNGAGKTTLIKLLTGLLAPTGGESLINGKNVEEQKESIGLMLGYEMIYYRMTGHDNLRYFARLYGVEGVEGRIEGLSRLLKLEKWMPSYVENYSLGMKCKLALARAMIHEPEILFLDEPTLGLDPAISFRVRKEIKTLGKTIFLTTHYVEEAVEMCDRVAIMSKGKVLEIGKPKDAESLKDRFIRVAEKIE